MKNIRNMCAACVIAGALLTACGQQDGGPATAGPSTTPAQTPVAPVSEPAQAPVAQRADIDFAVVPASVSECSEAPSQVKVSWQVRDTSVQEVRVEVADPGRDAWKVLSVGGRQGEVETGPWVEEGTRFQLVNAGTGEQLASHAMTGDSCR